jgi:hypothetical protein
MTSDLMKKLEAKMGTKHVLVDDWNTLGWEFSNLPLSHTRVCSLTNYTEAKAEGGSVTFTIEDDWTAEGIVSKFNLLSSEGSGPHGIPWWDGILHVDETVITEAEVETLAQEIIDACADEAQSSYWSPWRDNKPQRNLLFRDLSVGETEERMVEIPHEWDEADWKESFERANS